MNKNNYVFQTLTLKTILNIMPFMRRLNNLLKTIFKINLIQQSLLDAIRHFNMRIENDMKDNNK